MNAVVYGTIPGPTITKPSLKDGLVLRGVGHEGATFAAFV
jgi:hypothetical protein